MKRELGIARCGLAIDLENIRPSLTIHFEHGFDDIYILTHPVTYLPCIFSMRKYRQSVGRQRTRSSG